MIITCPECDTKYRYDERRFDGDATKSVKCTSCGLAFEAVNPLLAAAQTLEPTDSGPVVDIEPDNDRVESWEADLAEGGVPTPVTEEAEQPPASKPDHVTEIPPLPTDLRFSLAVIAGGQAGSVFQIHKPRIFLGRGSSMDIQLRDSEVSRRHSVLEIRDSEVTLSDLEATNGTWFNGAKIQTSTVGHQDEFTLGSTTLMLIVTPIGDTH